MPAPSAALRDARRRVQARNYPLRASKRLSRQGLYPFLEAEYARLPAGGRVLSVGAGGAVNERLAAHAAAKGLRVETLDLDPVRGPDLVGDVCTHPLPEGAYDAVVMSEVLEHVTAPHLALDNVRSALRPGGQLILTVPFAMPIHNRPRDYYRFTRYGLEHLLAEFSEVTVEERNTWPEAVNVLLVRLLKEPGRAARAATPAFIALAWLLAPLAWLIGRAVPADHLTTGYNAVAVR